MDDTNLRYPIGKFTKPQSYTSEDLNDWVAVFASFPGLIRSKTAHLTEEKLSLKYREGGWTIRQLVHHCADSHINSLVRVKLALTEDNPTIKPYMEDRWAELKDYETTPIAASLQIIDGVHARWCNLYKTLNNEELNRTFYHPENKNTSTLWQTAALYAWHCKHHLAHIEIAMKTEAGS